MKSSFTLIPFNIDTAPEIAIIGNINRQGHQLQIEYQLVGKLAQILIPQPAKLSERKYDLWQHTCLEFFLGIKDSTKYWEFNLSPAGHWNIFYFNNYRQNIAEEMAFQNLTFPVFFQENILTLNLKVNLDKIIFPQQDLVVGITAVIEDQAQQLSYWALSHLQPTADFHDRNSFLINLTSK